MLIFFSIMEFGILVNYKDFIIEDKRRGVKKRLNCDGDNRYVRYDIK